jgi:hypothetical protein
MVQTLTVWSNGISEINTGTNFLLCNGIPFTTALQDKLDSIESTISAAGISQLHVEKDTFREFEHVVSAGVVSGNDFGTIVLSADFDWIMQHVDDEAAAQAAAAAAAAYAEAEGATA